MQLSLSVTKLSCAVLGSSLAAAIFVTGTSASAQITIQSTGTLSGTIQLPNNNPNFNNRVTRIDTDSNGSYQRNIGSKNNPNYVPVYQSNYVKVETRSDGSLHYFVDFKGIPVISLDGILNSPILSGGELTAYTFQGKVPGTKFQGVVQDEFGLTKAFYTGIITDPTTGQQYQGTFQVNGQGPRYSDRNGGLSPTVFDFKSDLSGKPTVKSWQMNNVPLVRLTITIPTNATPITPSSSNNTPTPAPVVSIDNIPTPTPAPLVSVDNIPTPASVVSVDNIPTPASVVSVDNIPTPTPAPVVSVDNIPTSAPVVSVNSTSIPIPVVSVDSTPTPIPIVSVDSTPTPIPVIETSSAIAQAAPQAFTSSLPTIDTNVSNFSSPATAPDIEFSSGNSSAVNPVDLQTSTCSPYSINCRTKLNTSRQAIGPRSRVLVR